MVVLKRTEFNRTKANNNKAKHKQNSKKEELKETTEHNLVTILHEKLKKFPHTKNLSNFVDAFSSNQVGIIRTMNKLVL
jgi:hypothetical protein